MIPLNLDLTNIVTKPKINNPGENEEPRKLFIWQDDGSLQMRIDYSTLSAYSECNRKGFFTMIESKTSPRTIALVCGSAYHAALELYYRLRGTADLPDIKQRCRAVIEKEYLESGITIFDDHRTSEFCYSLFELYLRDLHNEPFEVLEFTLGDERIQAVEFGFSVPLSTTVIPASLFRQYGFGKLTDSDNHERIHDATSGEIRVNIEWTGVVDLVGYKHGRLWLRDHKTSSMLDTNFFDGFNNAAQPMGYIYAINKFFEEQKSPDRVAGFMLAAAITRKPPVKSGKGPEIHQVIYEYEPWQIAEWHSDTTILLEEFINNLTHNQWTSRRSQCILKYGKCTFFDVCTVPHNQRKLVLDTLPNNVWKPV